MPSDTSSRVGTGRRFTPWILAWVLAWAAASAAATQPPADGVAWRCSAGQTAGVPADDADTAVAIVCGEVRRAAGAAGGSYRVDLRPLGHALVLTLSREAPADSRTLRLDSIEELPVAAPRLAEALVQGLPLEATRRVDNLVVSETRYTPLRKGSLKPTLGVVGLGTLGHRASVGAGFALGLEYVTPRFAIPGELRWAGGGGQGAEASASALSISTGGRWYTSSRDVSPFVGAGLGWLLLEAHEDMTLGQRGFFGTADGLAPYLEGGVELLRLHRARLRASLRADLPTRQVRDFGYCDWDPQTRACAPQTRPERYVVPLTFGLSVSF